MGMLRLPLLSVYLGVVMVVVQWSGVQPTTNDGICTRLELVTKTRIQRVYQTYLESYYSYNYYDCNYRYGCRLNRERGRYVDEEQTYEDWETKAYCCTGYIPCASQDACTCQPVCHLACLNGNCTAPDQCTCLSGYSKQDGTENICEPVCSQSCIHGYCSLPETCTCDRGYQLDSFSPYTCRPVCTTPCINANCTSPDVCTCLAGYEKIFGDPHKCHPVCTEPCHNAACTEPGVCSCFVGYQKDPEMDNICNPVCSENCTNGLCTEPDVCSCLEGYSLQDDNHTCTPVCFNCSNAYCSAPEVCSCFSGYEKDKDDESTCFPVCSPECTNGNCTAPDSCECFDGFEITEDATVCKPFCSDGCHNGVCTEPEECSCLWGFGSELNTSSCTQSKTDNLDCSFFNTIDITESDGSCLNLTVEFQLGDLRGCKIFGEVLKDLERKKKDVSLIKLDCGPVSTLRNFKNSILLNLFCEVIEDQQTAAEQSSTEDYRLKGYSLIDESTTYEEFLSTYFSEETELTILSTEWKQEDTTVPSTQIPTHQFSVRADENSGSSDDVWGRVHRLELNITVHFLPLIKEKEITQGYFDSIPISQEQDWCLCQTNKTMSICANTKTQISLCPCQVKRLQLLGEESSVAASIVKVLAMAVVLGILVAVVVWYFRNELGYFGDYHQPPPRSTETVTPDTASVSSAEPKASEKDSAQNPQHRPEETESLISSETGDGLEQVELVLSIDS